jgi:hypothetical protein
MTMQTFPYRVRAGQRLPHEGDVLEEGQTVALTRAVAAEVRHLVEPIDAQGQVLPEPTAEQLELEARPPHEHEGILIRRRAELVLQLTDLQDIASRTQAAADAAAAEVTRTARAIAGIDAQLAPPPPASVAKTTAPRTNTVSESTTPPAPPAEKE